MKILFTGFFDPSYSRNRILKRSLEETGLEVELCSFGTPTPHNIKNLTQCLQSKNHDIVLIGHSDDQLAVITAKLFSKKPVVWDAFYSLYDTRVQDRKLVSAWNPKAWLYWFLDWINVTLADLVLVDTKAHARFFEHAYGLTMNKTAVVYVGTDTSVFYPRPEIAEEERLVGFYGKYIPLQGVSTIVSAAKLLEKEGVHFEIIGSGQEYNAVRALAEKLQAKNIMFHKRVPYEALPEYIARWSVVLGIFGTSAKSDRVIPNKVYEAAAMGKAIISKDTPAMRELFTNEKDSILTSTDPNAIASAIRRLFRDPALRQSVGTGARQVIVKNTTLAGNGALLKSVLQEISDSKIQPKP